MKKLHFKDHEEFVRYIHFVNNAKREYTQPTIQVIEVEMEDTI